MEHHECKQTNTSLTLSFFSTCSQYHHCSYHDNLEQYGITTSTRYSKRDMFTNATSFNRDLSSWDVSSVTTMVSGLGP